MIYVSLKTPLSLYNCKNTMINTEKKNVYKTTTTRMKKIIKNLFSQNKNELVYQALKSGEIHAYFYSILFRLSLNLSKIEYILYKKNLFMSYLFRCIFFLICFVLPTPPSTRSIRMQTKTL